MSVYTSIYSGSQIDTRLGYLNQDLKSTASPTFVGAKLSGETTSKALFLDANGYIKSSATTLTELGYLGGVTSAIQTQLNGKAASSHVHGNITNDGKIGTTASLPIITGTGGILQAGSFGTAAGTFCQGNDSRLSDARNPTSHTHGNITNDGKIGTVSDLPIFTTTSGLLATKTVADGRTALGLGTGDSPTFAGGTFSGEVTADKFYVGNTEVATNDLSNVSDQDFAVKLHSSQTTRYKLGVKVEIGNAHPETSVTPMYYNSNFAPSYTKDTDTFIDNGWSQVWPYNVIRPCVFKNGAVVYYLDPDDYTKKADGTPSVITGADGDVMIEVPKMYMKISSDTNYRYFELSSQAETGFTDYPFSYKGVVKDKFYIGAYKGFNLSGKLKSISGVTPTASLTRAQFRTLAQANGTGYEIVPYNKLILLQVLYLIRFKNLDSQTALGRGNVNSALKTTGATNSKGMCYGSTSGTTQMKCNGIEDFWGNIWEWIDGLTTFDVTGVHHIYTQDGTFTDDATGATSRGTFTANYNGYIQDINGTNELGFLVKEGSTSGSSSTYYCDSGYCSAGCAACFGGNWANDSFAGAFMLNVHIPPSISYSNVSARLAFCG